MSQEKLRKIAAAAIDMYVKSVNDNLADVVKADSRVFGSLRGALAGLASELVSARLVEKRTEGRKTTWVGRQDQLAGTPEEKLEAIAAVALRVVEEANEKGVLESLIQEDQGFFLRGVLDTETALRDFDYATPGNPLLREALGEDETQRTITRQVVVEEVPMERLHEVAYAALDFLDATHAARISLSESHDLFPIDSAFTELKEALRNAAYLVPGDSTARTEPYSAQSPRGTRTELEGVLEAAGKLRETIGDLSKLYDIAESARPDSEMKKAFLKTELGTKFILLGNALAAAQPERFERIVEERLDGKFKGSEILPKEVAENIAVALDLAERIANSAQVDTLSHHNVMFRGSLHKAAKEALQALDQQDAGARLSTVVKGYENVSGLTPASAKLVAETIEQLRYITQYAEPRGIHKAILAEEIDTLASRSDLVVTSGAYTAIAAHAGREGFDKSTLMEGRGVASFATLNEALGAGRMASPEYALRPIDRAMPEMTTAQYQRLPAAEKRRCRAFVIEPGKVEIVEQQKRDAANQPVFDAKGKPVMEKVEKKTLFTDYETSMVQDAKVSKYRQARIREHLRSQLVNEDGTPNYRLRTLLIGLDKRTIVAPNLDEARAVRALSQQLIMEHKRHIEEKREAYLAGAEKVTLRFKAEDVKRFMRTLDASRSTEPATLVKRDDRFVLEHPDAPTIASCDRAEGLLERARNGYRLHKIDAAELKAGLDAESPSVYILLENDRPAKVAPTLEALKPAKTAEKVAVL